MPIPPITPNYTEPLKQAGLTTEQAAVYEVLLKNGPNPARKIAQNTPFKRSLVYKILEDLGKLGLVTRRDEVGKVSVFEPAHPLKLKELAEAAEARAKNAQAALESVLGALTSDFNMISGGPGVRFYEGLEAVQKITEDSLTATGEIYSYVDNEAVNKYIPKINEDYVRKREKLGIKKKMITIDGPYIRAKVKTYNPQISELRVISGKYPFVSVMQIYNNKVSYLTLETLEQKKMIGVIIDHPDIARMQKSIFEYTWATAKPLLPVAPAAGETAGNTAPARGNSAAPPQSETQNPPG